MAMAQETYLIYHPDFIHCLEDYGIDIPLKDDRSEKVFKSLASLKVTPFAGEIKELNWKDLLLAHDNSYVDRLKSKISVDREMIKTYELVDSNGDFNRYKPHLAKKSLNQLLQHLLKQAYGSYLAMDFSLSLDFSYYLGGGMHHAMRNEGRGFCPINDIVIGIKKLQKEGRIKKAIVIDVDAHKGDGTAQITKDDDSIFTYSIHMKKGWPLNNPNKNDPSFIKSNCDVEILREESENYNVLLRKSLDFILDEYQFDLAVIVNGADPYEKDELLSSRELALTKEQMLERDVFLYNSLKEKKIPQAWLMAGGYGEHSWEIYSQFLLKTLPTLMG